MDPLPLQVLVLEGIRLPDIFQVLNDDMFPGFKLQVPAGAHFRRDILKVLLFWRYPVGHPFIGVVIAARIVLLKDISAISIQCFSQMLQQHLQRLIRRLLQ